MPYKLLVIDDFKVSNEIVSDSLRKLGYEVYCSQSGSNALTLVQDIKIHLIIADYIMPEMNGLQFLTNLRRISGYEMTPVIILSSVKDPDIINSARKHNINAWLNKPINLDQLKKVVTNSLKQ